MRQKAFNALLQMGLCIEHHTDNHDFQALFCLHGKSPSLFLQRSLKPP